METFINRMLWLAAFALFCLVGYAVTTFHSVCGYLPIWLSAEKVALWFFTGACY